MRQLISIITNQIVKQIKDNEINMVRLANFDDPIIYKSVCEILCQSEQIQKFIPKLTLEKYHQFEIEDKANWTQAMMYLHKGENSVFNSTIDAQYAEKSFVDFNHAITKWRNDSPDMPSNITTLVLLMGTEAAPDDKGSLKDTSFIISPKEIIEKLSNDYSEWFVDIFSKNDICAKEARFALNTLYRTIFSNVNVDIFKLSTFIDELHTMSFSTCQELICYICETLNENWSIPSIADSKAVPKVQRLCKGRFSDAKIIEDAIRFIERADDIPSDSTIKKLKEKFKKFSENIIDINSPYPEDTAQFPNYAEFEKCVLDFMCGINLNKNREKLLKVDYAVIDKIIGTKLPNKPSQKAPTVTGGAMEAYSKMFLGIAADFNKEYTSYPTNYSIRVDRVSLPDCLDEQKEEAFMRLCNFMGGILAFFNSANIECNGETVKFVYENEMDPFNYANFHFFESIVRSTGKWGDPCKIQFRINASNNNSAHNYEYKWAFSPYSPWLNAFSFLEVALFKDSNSYSLPSMVVCKNIQDYLRCESEDEFYAQLGQIDADVLYREHIKEVQHYFEFSPVFGIFNALCNEFKDFALKLTGNGLFSALNELRTVVDTYTKMMDYLQANYDKLTDIQHEKIALLINCFTISSNQQVIETCNMDEVLLPAYHPVMLEKIDAQQLFLRDGFAEIMASQLNRNLSQDKVKTKLDSLVQLASITQGADTVIKKASNYMTCKSMWEYYGVYFDTDNANDLVSGNAFGNAIVTDDEDASAMLRVTPMSNVVVRNIMDYIRTFPARVDGLNVAFIAPTDMQHIVAAVHMIAKEFDSEETLATINIKIICVNSKKNSSSYLKRWLDSYFDDERNVKVNTFLRNITIGTTESDVDCLSDLLKNSDLCFNYNILKAAGIQYDKTGEEIIDKEQAKFPMTFTPDTIAATHGKARKVCISQFQFLAAKSHTQASYVIGNPNSIPGLYRTFKTLELTDIQNRIIELSHDACKWVVCIDPAIDRRMLENTKSRIIGFTTGEGCYGELNVTVSARKDILSDIKVMLTKRIREKFSNWDYARLQKAAQFCVDEMSRHMDGSRILKALNPYDYEIHSFLAYILTLQMLGMTEPNDAYAVRALISLDSYKHWFVEDDELSKDNKRPDFMLIEIPKSQENLDSSQKLKIKIKIIECKMGFQNENHLIKAQSQLEKGLRTMSINWNPKNTSIMHRYWLNQLYRAIIFSPLNLDNTSAEYNTIRNKIYGILSNNYELEWTGDIFAFWLDSNANYPIEYVLDSTLPTELSNEDINLQNLICHCCGQMFIQKMLVPPDERASDFSQNDIPNPEENLNEIDDDECEENADSTESFVAAETTGETIPREGKIYLPFMHYLDDDTEHSRKESLKWFAEHFNISHNDQQLFYDNGNRKWETVLDAVITKLRKNTLLENTEFGTFHLTDFGKNFAQAIESSKQNVSFESAIAAYRETIANNNQAVEHHDDTLDGNTNTNNTDSISTENKSEETLAEVPVKSLSNVRFLIGEDQRTKERYYWEFGNRELNNRHLLINGNSGCGKTYCIQALLMEASTQNISSVIFDYTGGFAPSKLEKEFKEQLGKKIVQRFVRKDRIPVNPFKKQLIQMDEDFSYPEEDADVARKVADVFRSVYKTFGDQQFACMYDAILNGLKNHGAEMNFDAMVSELENIDSARANSVLSKLRPFTDLKCFVQDDSFSWRDIQSSEGEVFIFQLAGYDRDTQILLTEFLLWDIWNYCTQFGDETKPMIIVMDEAQNLSHQENTPSGKILTEGRKFGISGWYATQFMKPQLDDAEIQRLQQAGQKLYFCPPDEGVMTVAKNIDISTQGSKEWAEKLKKLKKGECVTCGNMIKNGKWSKYEPKIVKVTSLQARLSDDKK